jgi:hypothetical protein
LQNLKNDISGWQFLKGAGLFPMRLLHFRPTFVEKLFAIHAKVEMFKRDGRPIGAYPSL